jgi:hypothetical protein
MTTPYRLQTLALAEQACQRLLAFGQFPLNNGVWGSHCFRAMGSTLALTVSANSSRNDK